MGKKLLWLQLRAFNKLQLCDLTKAWLQLRVRGLKRSRLQLGFVVSKSRLSSSPLVPIPHVLKYDPASASAS